MKPVRLSTDATLLIGEAVCFALVSLLLVSAVASEALPVVGTALQA